MKEVADMLRKKAIVSLLLALLLMGCNSGTTTSGAESNKPDPLSRIEVETIVQTASSEGDTSVAKEYGKFDANVKYVWAKCKVTWVYAYTNKTYVYTSGCGTDYWWTSKKEYRSTLASVASQAMVKNWKLNFQHNGRTWSYFVF
jgi:hypothetical protein